MMKTALLLLSIFSFGALAQAPTTNCTNANLAAKGCVPSTAMYVYAYAGDSRRFEWTPNAQDVPRRAQLFYEVEVYTWPAGVRVQALTTSKGTEFADWTPPRAGLYYVRVRTCDGTVCGSWTDGRTDPPLPSTARGWMITVAVKPPTGGGIE